MRIGYLGPPGTFTEEALSRCDKAAGAELQDYPSIADAYEAVAQGEVDASFIAIENSLEGSVTATLDLLVHRSALRNMPRGPAAIRQNLLARPGNPLEGVRRVLSIPIALAQCQVFLRSRLPGVPLEPALSTAEAARRAVELPDAAAVGSRAAAARYGLALIAEDIQDLEGNTTRFVLVAREDEKPTGRDRTSIAFTLNRDRPGGLYEVLGVLARRGINLSKIESRPSRKALGHYVFFIDFEGHRSNPTGSEAMAGVLERVHALHLLGSYPRTDGGP